MNECVGYICRQSMDSLTDDERAVLTLRIDRRSGYTRFSQKKVSVILDMPPEKVARLKKSALQKVSEFYHRDDSEIVKVGMIDTFIDHRGVFRKYYNKPKAPIPPPEGYRWKSVEPDEPPFVCRLSRTIGRVRLGEAFRKERKKEERRTKKIKKRQALEHRRFTDKLTLITRDRAIKIQTRIEIKGWTRIAVGRWQNHAGRSPQEIVFLSHTQKHDMIYLRAYLKK